MSVVVNGVTRFVRRSFTENLGLKLVAALVALLLVVFVRFQEKEERWVDVEVNVKRPSESAGVILTAEPPDMVRVTLRGRGAALQNIKEGPISPVVMDISNRQAPGSFTHYFEPEDFSFTGVEVVDINPDSVPLRVERLTTKRLPIRVKTSGRLESGTKLDGEPEVVPSEVTISGPASVVRAMSSIDTNPVDVEGLGEGEHSFNVPLARRADGLSLSRDEVTVAFSVSWKMGQRMLSGLLVKGKGANQANAEIRPAEVAVSLTGPQVALDKLDPALVSPHVELDGGEPDNDGIFRAKIKITGLPSDISVKSVVPETVLVKTVLPLVPNPK